MKRCGGRWLRLACVVGTFLLGTTVIRAQPYLVSGVIQPDSTGTCLLLTNPEGDYWGGPFLLEDYGSYIAGDTVTVLFTGHSDRVCVPEGAWYRYLTGTTVVPRSGCDFGCGRFQVEPEYHCRRVHTAKYGSFLFWDDPGVVSDGDSVQITGTLSFSCSWTWECAAEYCLDDVTLSACPDTNTASHGLTWGRLKRAYQAR